MFSNIFISVINFARAERFYDQVLGAIGVEKRWSDHERPWAGWHSEGKARPYFVICHPFDQQNQNPGNGQMVAFAAQGGGPVIFTLGSQNSSYVRSCAAFGTKEKNHG